MISKNKIKFLCSLKIKKYRDQHQKALLEGFRLIDESINFNARINNIWMTDDHSDNDFLEKIKKFNINIDIINEKDLKFISDTKHSQGIIAEVDTQKYYSKHISNAADNHIVILDGVSDSGNLGTILRTSAWYGIKSIILTSNCIDPFNTKVLRSAVGAHFYFDNIVSLDINKLIEYLDNHNYKVFCADLEGKEISRINLRNKWALVLGSEAHGISKEFQSFDKITIKKEGKIESLNVSVACGIILDQFLKNNY